MTKSLFIFGYGYTARTLVKRLAQEDGWRFAGTTRSEDKAGAMRGDGVAPVIWDGGDISAAALDDASHILVSTPPTDAGCPTLAAAGAQLAAHASNIQWLGYLSTNGVYGDHQGEWVDESSATLGESTRARRRIDAEERWRSLAQHHGLPLTIFRLPGIYGPGRSAIDAVREGKAKRIYKKGQVFSRMHVEDIAAALAASMESPQPYALYNLADDEPAPPQEVVEYASTLLGVSPPPLIPIEEADLSEMAKSFYADNKRVSNALMKRALGVSLAYPTYREGLRSILADETEA